MADTSAERPVEGPSQPLNVFTAEKLGYAVTDGTANYHGRQQQIKNISIPPNRVDDYVKGELERTGVRLVVQEVRVFVQMMTLSIFLWKHSHGYDPPLAESSKGLSWTKRQNF